MEKMEKVIATEIASPNPESGYNYSVIFGFEKNFDKQVSADLRPVALRNATTFARVKHFELHAQVATLWMASNWKLSLTYSAIYLIVVFGGRRYMRDRPRLELRPVLSAWNFMLAAFRSGQISKPHPLITQCGN